MTEIGIEELKRIQLDMMKEIHAFCITHGIKYSLAYGSLLGAVRHKGYIPWDDDIDIMLRREDYDRFVQQFVSDFCHVVDYSTNPEYGLPFAKVEDVRTKLVENAEGSTEYGVFIDVFPIDHIPDKISKRKAFYRYKAFWNALFNLKIIRINKQRSILKNAILAIGHFLLALVPRLFLVKKMRSLIIRYRSVPTEYMGIVAPADSKIQEALPARFFDDYIEIPFEGERFMAIKAYDEYLKAAYGDYMELPPVEKRAAHHSFKAYWK